MNLYAFSRLILLFLIYSVIGWLCELIYSIITAKKLINRGILHGPYCPVYGLAVIILLLTAIPLRLSPGSLFALAVVTAAVIEYCASALLERVFGFRWWDYSHIRLNINGRVGLPFTITFGVLGYLTVTFLHPAVIRLMNLLPFEFAIPAASLLFGLFIFDTVKTASDIYTLRDGLLRAQWLLDGLRLNGYFPFKEDAVLPEKAAAAVSELQSIADKDNMLLLLRSYITLSHSRFNGAIEYFRREAITHELTTRERLFAFFHMNAAETVKKDIPASSTVETGIENLTEESRHFAAGLNFYKLFWVFFIGCIFGYIAETIFCFAAWGNLESRQGLIYGPFNQVYGFGAMLLLLILNPIRTKKYKWIFLLSALIGGAFEWICSYTQEMTLGSVSWDYSTETMSIGGRTSIYYMMFWGMLGLLFIKGVYPYLSRTIERIPNSHGEVITWVLIVFMLINMGISALAVQRWSNRERGVPPATALDEYLDTRYPNADMLKVYPNMRLK